MNRYAVGAFIAIVWMHFMLIFGNYIYARDMETASMVFILTPLIGVLGATVAWLTEDI